MRKKKPAIDLKKAINMEYPVETYLAILIGLFFLVVSYNKLMTPHHFAMAVFQGHLVPYPLVNIAALLFMGLEAVAAFAVVFMKPYRRAGLWILIVLLCIYSTCVSINLFRDLNTVCGCFGSSARAAAISWWTVVRNLGILTAALFALR